MEGVEGDRASSSDESESDDEAEGLKNAYSVGDLLGELNSDVDNNDESSMRVGKNLDCTIQKPDDSSCPDSNMSMNGVQNVTSDEPVELIANATLDRVSIECHTIPDRGGSVPTNTYSRVYDEVLTENIYQDPAENDDCLTASK